MAPTYRIETKPTCFFIKHWNIWVKVSLIKNETQFRLHSSLGEKCSKTLFFSPVLLLFSYQTPHCIKTICPHRALQCQALLAKNYNLRSSIFRISWTQTFCWPLLNQMKTVFQSNKIFPHGKILKSKTVMSFSFCLLELVLLATKCWKYDVFVRKFSWGGLPAQTDAALVCLNYSEVVTRSF